MDTKIILIYCICSDFLKKMGHPHYEALHMSDEEILTLAIVAAKRFSLDIPRGSTIYGDRAYNNYDFEDFLANEEEIRLISQRRKNSKRPLLGELWYLQSRMRKRIETVFSQITGIFLRSINAVTSKGFEIKIFNFILAYTFKVFFKEKFALA